MAAGLVIGWLGVSWARIARLRQGLIRKERGWLCLVMRMVVVGQRWQWGVAEDVRGEGGAVVVGGRGGGLRTTTATGLGGWSRSPLAASCVAVARELDGESAFPPQQARTLTRPSRLL